MSTTSQSTRTVLRSDEFTCPSCVGRIEGRLRALEGVTAARVRFASGRVEVDHDPRRVSADDLVAAVRAAGYRAVAGSR
ncbi:heavy-metal-associated domain-containing protein [Miltoncostaea marina]|uniref:heavy-metal-associated domain-containing protein n=1 Tax=Miltoncostaea marina TaxID=2843215 RepID=UPI001C3D6F92|nr:heavy-metal-associated domain-containing protein [Miltoncostaea marina]